MSETENEALTPIERAVLDRIEKGPATRQGLIEEGVVSSSMASKALRHLQTADLIREVGERRVKDSGRSRTLWVLKERHPDEVS